MIKFSLRRLSNKDDFQNVANTTTVLNGGDGRLIGLAATQSRFVSEVVGAK